MRFFFKTDYNQDIDLFRDNTDRFWYGLLVLVLLAAPFVLEDFWLGEISYVFILSIVGIGLMLLTGYTGQVSLGHAAFLGIGAYTHAILLNLGVPFFISIPVATLLSAVIGAVIGRPALRLTGVYLAIATLAFAFIIEQILIRWEHVTGGFKGFAVDRPEVFGISIVDDVPFYYIAFGALVLAVLAALNLLRSPTGRAFVAIRDSEIAAQSMGVNLAAYKTLAFSLSAGFTGFGGTLFAHKIGYLAPDAFNILLSIQLLLMVVVGGLGSLHGAIYGAIFVGSLPQLIAILRDYLPESVSRQPGLEPGIFGLILVFFILFEPLGIYGRWLKVKLYFSLFPLYKKATFKRQKTYTKSERNR
ncbi:MAG: branched-chain amino acid ABC transporter permease [Ferrovibrio sp.]|uniref:branched-chain amino acid ABC transporter permease n=1 Tax=Ferrovibrio sp. TaxID=1917215 RepID=UPI0026296C05|nr:branched-chain amino acid ABC transporter permease [Ferrovibrio sp.]MCW0235671.1 branched-chain amino acid ABC transporter permease [Ferrovibrio sp.]